MNSSSISDNSANENEEIVSSMYDFGRDDANWIMTSAFIIFTMQTGFGMLESGCVSRKNEVNIMMKNVVDIFLGGVSYWAIGYGLSFGTYWKCPFFAVGDFFLDATPGTRLFGPKFTSFTFQLSFATTATTIVSGAMAERCNFKAYCIFSMLNTLVYCVPAGWIWGDHGFLKRMGAVDIAGSGPVHLVGGFSALAAALILKPRLGRYNSYGRATLGTPVNCAMGLFVLWWGWLAFNCGSTYGVTGEKWGYAGKAAVMTMVSSFGGGISGLTLTLLINKGQTNIMDIINSVLGAMVAITAGCFLYTAWISFFVGIIGGILSVITSPLLDLLHIDDPVGATAAHGASGIWGIFAVGFFAENPINMNITNGRNGLFRGGGWYLLSVQSLAILSFASYSFIITVTLLWIINKITPLRVSEHVEILGADITEHMIRHKGVGISTAIAIYKTIGENYEGYQQCACIAGFNSGHEGYLNEYVRRKLKKKNEELFSKISNNDKHCTNTIVWID